MEFFANISWHRLLRWALVSQLIAYPLTLVLFTLARITGIGSFFQFSLLVYPCVYFLFGLRYFRKSSTDWNTHVVSALIWAAIGYAICLVLYVPIYAAPIADQLQKSALTLHGLNAVILLLAGFFTRPRLPPDVEGPGL